MTKKEMTNRIEESVEDLRHFVNRLEVLKIDATRMITKLEDVQKDLEGKKEISVREI